MHIFTYWEGDQPPIIRKCIRTLIHHNPDTFKVYGREDIEREFPQAASLNTSKPYRSDLFRLLLMYKYGGVWVDTDTICLKPIRLDTSKDLVAFTNKHDPTPGKILASPFAARPESPVIAKMLCEYETLIKKPKIAYGSTSTGLLTNRQNDENVVIQEHWKYHPIPWYKSNVYLKKAPAARHETSGYWNPNGITYHLTNKIVHHFKDFDEPRIDHNKTFTRFLFDKSFGRHPAVQQKTIEIIQRTPPNGRVIEVGVFRAMNGRHLLQQREDITYIGIDCFGDHTQDYVESKDAKAFIPAKKWRNIEHTARNMIKPFGERGRIIKGRSGEVDVEPADLIFLDADHSFPGVMRDIVNYLPKVKSGGYIGGHDYGDSRWGVTKAVNTLVTRLNGKLELGKDSTWFIQV